MKQFVDRIFPPIERSKIPYWRLVLRGCAQLCLQRSEVTGLLFLVAVLVASPLSFAYMLVAAIIAPGARLLLGAKPSTLETGLPGLNPCLVALALPAFFQTGWTNPAMWGVLLICVIIVVVLVHVSVAVLPFPILAAPFIVIIFILFALSSSVDILQPIVLGSVEQNHIHPIRALFFSMGQVAFVISTSHIGRREHDGRWQASAISFGSACWFLVS